MTEKTLLVNAEPSVRRHMQDHIRTGSTGETAGRLLVQDQNRTGLLDAVGLVQDQNRRTAGLSRGRWPEEQNRIALHLEKDTHGLWRTRRFLCEPWIKGRAPRDFSAYRPSKNSARYSPICVGTSSAGPQRGRPMPRMAYVSDCWAEKLSDMRRCRSDERMTACYALPTARESTKPANRRGMLPPVESLKPAESATGWSEEKMPLIALCRLHRL